VPEIVVCALDGGEYEAGARFAMSVTMPIAEIPTFVPTNPASSLNNEHDDRPEHAERAAPEVALRTTVAPATGVVPSASNTWKRMGVIVCPPTGTAGLGEGMR
jgi:hypothetical protein